MEPQEDTLVLQLRKLDGRIKRKTYAGYVILSRRDYQEIRAARARRTPWAEIFAVVDAEMPGSYVNIHSLQHSYYEAIKKLHAD